MCVEPEGRRKTTDQSHDRVKNIKERGRDGGEIIVFGLEYSQRRKENCDAHSSGGGQPGKVDGWWRGGDLEEKEKNHLII